MNRGDNIKADSTFRIQSKFCSAKLSRGVAKTSTYSTSNLIMHLKNQKDVEFKLFVNRSWKL